MADNMIAAISVMKYKICGWITLGHEGSWPESCNGANKLLPEWVPKSKKEQLVLVMSDFFGSGFRFLKAHRQSK
jgi:hypothetical protein